MVAGRSAGGPDASGVPDATSRATLGQPAAALEVDIVIAAGQRSIRAQFQLDGGILVVFGPSGAGKTLTVRSVAGLVRPRQGRICAGGEILFDASTNVDVLPENRRVGYVPQSVSLFPHLRVIDNVAFGLRARGRADWQETARAWLERLHIAALAERRIQELSGGEAQRVALARALAPEPRLLLLDEPFSALDMQTRREMRRVVRELQVQSGVPMLFVTHSPGEAREMGDRLVQYDDNGTSEEGIVQEMLPTQRTRDEE